MKLKLAATLVLAAAGLFAAIELVSCTRVKSSLPGESWTRTAPEHLGLRFEKIDRELPEIQPEAAASAIERLGYLVWDRGETAKAIALAPALTATMAGLADDGAPASLAQRLDFEASAAADNGGAVVANARDLLRLGLLLLSGGDWGGEDLAPDEAVRAVLNDASLWESGKTRRGNLRFLAAGDPATSLLILIPEIDTAMAVVAAENAPLAEPSAYADLLSVSFRPIW